MKDLLEKILAYLPVYIPDLIQLVSGPKRFVAERNRGQEGDAMKAFTFLGISLAIFFALQAPLVASGKEFLSDTGGHGLLYLFFVVAFSAIVRLSWRIVGGKADYQRILVTSSYYAGIVAIGLALAILCSMGILRMFYPESYALFIRFVATSNLREVSAAGPRVLRGILVAFATFAVVTLPTLVWGLIGWGAYRELNQLPRSHSSVALLLTIVLSLPIVAVEMTIALAS
jgi:hypothetical protein